MPNLDRDQLGFRSLNNDLVGLRQHFKGWDRMGLGSSNIIFSSPLQPSLPMYKLQATSLTSDQDKN